jgi:hypothetical protein
VSAPHGTLAFTLQVTSSLFRPIQESRILKNFGGHLQKANTHIPGIRRGSQTLSGDQSHEPAFLWKLLLALRKLYSAVDNALIRKLETVNYVPHPFWEFWPLKYLEGYYLNQLKMRGFRAYHLTAGFDRMIALVLPSQGPDSTWLFSFDNQIRFWPYPLNNCRTTLDERM